MVVITYEMQQAVDDNAIQFFLKINAIGACVLPDAVYAYEQVSGEFVPLQ